MATESTPASSATSGFADVLGVKEQKNAALGLLSSGLERMKLQNESLRLQNAQQTSVVSALQTQQEQEQFRNQMERAATVDPEMVPQAAADFAEQNTPAFLRDRGPLFENQSRSQQLTEEQLSDPAFRDELLRSKEANMLSATLGIPVDLLSGILGIFGADIGSSTDILGSEPSPETKLRRLAMLNEVSGAGRQQSVDLATAGIDAAGRGSAVRDQLTAGERTRVLMTQAHLNRQLEKAGQALPSGVMSSLTSGDPEAIRKGIKEAEAEGFTADDIEDLVLKAKEQISKSVDTETRDVPDAEFLAADASIGNLNQIAGVARQLKGEEVAAKEAEITKIADLELPSLKQRAEAQLQSTRFRGLVIRGIVVPKRFDTFNAKQLTELLPETRARYIEAERNEFKSNQDLKAALDMSSLIGELQKKRKAKGG